MTDKSKKNIDTKPIKVLAKLLDELNLTEISYSDKEFSVSVSKSVSVNALPQSNISSSSKGPGVDDNNNSDYQNDPRVIIEKICECYEKLLVISRELLSAFAFYNNCK